MAKRVAKRRPIGQPKVVEEIGVKLNEATMQAWHRRLARAAGQLSLTLSRKRRSPTLVADLLGTLEPVLAEMREVGK